MGFPGAHGFGSHHQMGGGSGMPMQIPLVPAPMMFGGMMVAFMFGMMMGRMAAARRSMMMGMGGGPGMYGKGMGMGMCGPGKMGKMGMGMGMSGGMMHHHHHGFGQGECCEPHGHGDKEQASEDADEG